MSLPTQITLPLVKDYENREKYLDELVKRLEEMYETITFNINGTIRNYNEKEDFSWVPTLNGTTPGSFTYTYQYGWSIRRNIFVSLYFNIGWSATTAGGNIYVELPYKVLVSQGQPFIGPVQFNALTLGTGYTSLTVSADPDTYKGTFYESGSGKWWSAIGMPSSGEIAGSLTYIGVEDE